MYNCKLIHHWKLTIHDYLIKKKFCSIQFSLLLRLCTGRKKFFWFFSQMSSFSTTLSHQNKLLNSHKQFFSQRYGHIKFWHLSEQPYEHSHCLFGAYHSAFENLSWKFVLAGFDGLWIRIYSEKIDISIYKMADSKWRIEIYEIKRFRSLKIFGHWEI